MNPQKNINLLYYYYDYCGNHGDREGVDLELVISTGLGFRQGWAARCRQWDTAELKSNNAAFLL